MNMMDSGKTKQRCIIIWLCVFAFVVILPLVFLVPFVMQYERDYQEHVVALKITVVKLNEYMDVHGRAPAASCFNPSRGIALNRYYFPFVGGYRIGFYSRSEQPTDYDSRIGLFSWEDGFIEKSNALPAPVALEQIGVNEDEGCTMNGSRVFDAYEFPGPDG